MGWLAKWTVIAGVFGLAGTAAAQPAPLRLSYDVRYAGVSVAAIDLNVDLRTDRFEIVSTARTVGLIAIAWPWVSEGRTVGRVRGQTLIPEAHRAEGRMRSTRLRFEVDYRDGRALAFRREVEPPSSELSRVPESDRRAASDPVSAMLRTAFDAAFGRGCAGRIAGFDGFRLHEMNFTDRGRQPLPAGAPRHFGTTGIMCEFTYVGRAGPAGPGDRIRPGRVWFAAVRDDGVMAPLWIETDTRWGRAYGVLVSPTGPLALDGPRERRNP